MFGGRGIPDPHPPHTHTPPSSCPARRSPSSFVFPGEYRAWVLQHQPRVRLRIRESYIPDQVPNPLPPHTPLQTATPPPPPPTPDLHHPCPGVKNLQGPRKKAEQVLRKSSLGRPEAREARPPTPGGRKTPTPPPQTCEQRHSRQGAPSSLRDAKWPSGTPTSATHPISERAHPWAQTSARGSHGGRELGPSEPGDTWQDPVLRDRSPGSGPLSHLAARWSNPWSPEP